MKKKITASNDENEMKTEYNFSNGVRGKYAQKFENKLSSKKIHQNTHEYNQKNSDVSNTREPGFLKGKISINDDFDEPIEDYKDYI